MNIPHHRLIPEKKQHIITVKHSHILHNYNIQVNIFLCYIFQRFLSIVNLVHLPNTMLPYIPQTVFCCISLRNFKMDRTPNKLLVIVEAKRQRLQCYVFVNIHTRLSSIRNMRDSVCSFWLSKLSRVWKKFGTARVRNFNNINVFLKINITMSRYVHLDK